MDIYTKTVKQVIKAYRKQQQFRLTIAYWKLFKLNPEDVLAELFNQVEDELANQDRTTLLTHQPQPPIDINRIITAVDQNNLRDLHDYANGNLTKLINEMITLISYLQEAKNIAP